MNNVIKEWEIEKMLKDIDQCYDPECLKMATVQEFVENAVAQLWEKGYRKPECKDCKAVQEAEQNPNTECDLCGWEK